MIVEIFDEMVRGALRPSGLEHSGEAGLTLDDLAPIFDKMELPLPKEEVDISWSRDGGYILFLNPYAAVLKIFPCSKNAQEFGSISSGVNGEAKIKTETKHSGNIYHPASLPPIGVVRFDEMAIQLMPGIAHGKHAEWRRDDVFYAMKNDIGCSEFNEYNYGKSKGKILLLDTVDDLNLDRYGEYHKSTGLFGQNNLLKDTVQAAARYERVQQSFYDAWTGKKPFGAFWQDMKQAKDDGLLVAGWDNSHLELDFKHKGGNLVEIAKRYEDRLALD